MAKPPLLILVEGPTDEAFFKRAVVPRLRSTYGEITVVPYARMQAKLVSGIFRTFADQGAEYLLVCDRDTHVHACKTACISRAVSTYSGLDPKRVRIVEEAIESWYAAVAGNAMRKTRQWQHSDTTGLSKSDFASLASHGETAYDLQQEILTSPDLTAGRKRNRSLEYFFARLPLREAV